MRWKRYETMGSGDLFRARLEQIINMKRCCLRTRSNWWNWPLQNQGNSPVESVSTD